MATLRQKFDATQDTKFSQRVRMGAVVVAYEILGEPTSTPGHVQRWGFAMAVLTDPPSQEVRLSAAVITDDATFDTQFDVTQTPPAAKANTAADTALLTRLRDVWSQISGVQPDGS